MSNPELSDHGPEGIPGPVAQFIHEGQLFEVHVNPGLIPGARLTGLHGESVVCLGIYGETGVLHGQIFGELYSDPDGRHFDSSLLANMAMEQVGRHTFRPEFWHVPGVVRESIVQLLLSGFTDEWNSSDVLTKGGKGVYESLLTDGRLDGQRIDLPTVDPDSGLPKCRYSFKPKR